MRHGRRPVGIVHVLVGRCGMGDGRENPCTDGDSRLWINWHRAVTTYP